MDWTEHPLDCHDYYSTCGAKKGGGGEEGKGGKEGNVTMAGKQQKEKMGLLSIYTGEMLFNRLLGNDWSDLDDFFCRPPGNFNSDKKVKKSAGQHSSTCVRLLH